MIDLSQVVDVITNPRGADLLDRDASKMTATAAVSR
jgi:serine/threonine-protein kinase RIO1